jgi:hypothetical protein
MVIEGVTLPDWNVEPVAWVVMVNASAGSYQLGLVVNDAGTDVIVGSYANLPPTITPPDIALPITYPVTLTIERFERTVTTSAVDAAKAVLDLGTNDATNASAYDPRITFGRLDGGPTAFLASMTVSLIEFSGDNVPDVNLPPPPPSVSSITRTGAIDEAFTSGTAEWEVTFSETVKNVTGDDFTRVLTGDATADEPTVAPLSGTGRVFTVTAANVGALGGGIQTIGLNFKDETDVVTTVGDAPIGGSAGPAYSFGVTMPAVGLLGLGLAAGAIAALGASAARRRRD